MAGQSKINDFIRFDGNWRFDGIFCYFLDFREVPYQLWNGRSIQYGYIIEAAISYYPIRNGWKLWYGKNGLFYYKSIQDWRSYDLQNLGLKIHNFSLELKQSKTPPAASCWILSTLVRRYVFFNPRCCKSWDWPNPLSKSHESEIPQFCPISSSGSDFFQSTTYIQSTSHLSRKFDACIVRCNHQWKVLINTQDVFADVKLKEKVIAKVEFGLIRVSFRVRFIEIRLVRFSKFQNIL